MKPLAIALILTACSAHHCPGDSGPHVVTPVDAQPQDATKDAGYCIPMTGVTFPECDWDMNDYCCPVDWIYCNPRCQAEMEGDGSVPGDDT